MFRDTNAMIVIRNFNLKEDQEIIFKKYVYRRQILKDLASDYNRSLPWIKKQIFEYELAEKIHNPREVVIVCDATFYGKKKDKLGTLVFKDISSKEILIWKHVQSELVKDYKQLLQRLIDLGYIIEAIIIDGKRGLYKAFKDYVQLNINNSNHFYKKAK